MLKKTLAMAGVLGLVAALTAIPADAGKGSGKGGGKVKGHVIKVEQQTRTGNDGESTQLTIRTRNGDQMRLNLGDGCQGCVKVGDQVQARLQGKQGPNGVGQAQSIKVRRGGEMFSLHNNGSGNMIRQQGRFGDGSGAGQQNENNVRTRLKDGSNCNDSGLRSGQGGANSGGGSRGGGGGGRGGRG